MATSTILLDGAAGTCLWEKASEQVPVWRYNLESPAIVTELHREYVEAGSQIILSNTFGANGMAVGKTSHSVEEIVSAGVRLAREAAAGRAQVGLDIGPLTGLLEPYGDIEPEEAEALYAQQIGAGMAEGPDLIFLETFMDIEMLKIAAKIAKGYSVPVFCSMSFEKSGRTLMGNSVQTMAEELEPLGVDAVGLNCSLGPDSALPIIGEFRKYTQLPLLFKPNAGMPEVAGGQISHAFGPERFAQNLLAARELGVTYLGGCCGTSPAYIRQLRKALTGP